MQAEHDGLAGPLDRFSLVLLTGVGLLFLCKAPLAIGSAFEADEFDLYRQAIQFLADPAARMAIPHKLLGAALYSLGALTGQDDPVVGLIVNRLVAVVLCLMTYLLTMRIAGRLFGPRAAVHALVGLGSVFVFIDHSYTARTDFIYLPLSLLALDLALRRTPLAMGLSGAVMGLALAASLKSSLLAVSLFAGLVVASAVPRRWVDLLRHAGSFAAGLAGTVLFYLALRALFAGGQASLVGDAAAQVATVSSADTGTPFLSFWMAMLRQNAVFVAVSLASLGLAVVRCWQRRGDDDGEVIAVTMVAAYTIAALSYPQTWPYFLATLAPGLALFWGSACGDAHQQLQQTGSRALKTVAIAALVAVGFALPADRIQRNMAIDNDYQIAVVDRLHQILGPEDSYFDGTGMALTLPRSDDIWLDVINQTAFRQHPEAISPLIADLTDSQIGAVVLNERVDALPEEFQQFRRHYFVQDWGSVFVPGADLDTAVLQGYSTPFPVLTTGTYHVRGEADAWRHLHIDGEPFGGPVLRLKAGDHQISVLEDVGRVRVLRLAADFEETREPLDSRKALFPKESFILGH